MNHFERKPTKPDKSSNGWQRRRLKLLITLPAMNLAEQSSVRKKNGWREYL